MPLILYGMACGAAAGQDLAQNLSTTLLGMVWAGFDGTNETLLPASCC